VNEEIGAFLHQHVPLLGALSREGCNVVAGFMHLQVYKKDQLILRQGDIGRGMFILMVGQPKCHGLKKVRVSVLIWIQFPW
jgi:signal-transduction protein with cAMP-binding, CBS, and nucleotidyltransferase domain